MKNNHIRKASALLNRASLHNKMEKEEQNVERLKKEINAAEEEDSKEDVSARLNYGRIYARANTRR